MFDETKRMTELLDVLHLGAWKERASISNVLGPAVLTQSCLIIHGDPIRVLLGEKETSFITTEFKKNSLI